MNQTLPPPRAQALPEPVAPLLATLNTNNSPLGAMTDWPVALRNAVNLILPADAQIVLFWGPDYVALYNDTYAPTIGLKHPRALGRPGREGWAELWDDLHPLLANVRESGETFSDRDRAFTIERFGYPETVYFDISYSAVPDDDGGVGGVLCLVAETTERVRAARQLGDERDRLAQMFDQAPGFMAVLRQPNHVFEQVNASYAALVGGRDVLGLPIRQALPELEGQAFFDILDRVAETGEPYRGIGTSVALRGAGGEILNRRVDFIYQPVTDSDGRVSAIFVEGIDVTDRVWAEERLVLSEESLRLATEAAEIGTWDLDIERDHLTWSDRTRAMFGIAPGVPVSMEDFRAGLHPDDRDTTFAAFASALDPARRALYDVEYRTVGAADGVVRWVAAKGRGLFHGNRCVRAIGTVIDITRHKRDEAVLRESEERFRALADSAPAFIWLSDARGRTLFANRWFETVLGLDVSGRSGPNWHQLVHPDDRARAIKAGREKSEAQAPMSGDLRILDRHGSMRWVHVEARPRYLGERFVGYVGVAVDVNDAHLAGEALERAVAERTAELASVNRTLTAQIAERERMAQTLHQMQRLEAVGQLTSGVAHDFNNLLTVVLGNVGMIERTARAAGLDARTLVRLDHVRSAAERGAALTQQLLAFSRRQRLDARATDLNAVVVGMRGLLDSSLGSEVSVDMALADDLWPALVDQTHLELVILNLAINARDAMAVGGTVRVSTANARVGAPARPEDPPAGEHVVVSVADTGAGMPAEVLARAFEPFFTTKEVGKGSGLGLAQVFGFAKQSGGGVRIDTEEGRGTTVSVFLPRGEVSAPAAAAPLDHDATPREALDGLILVVDDDAAVRSVTADALAAGGARVVEAENGQAALAMLQAHGEIAAVVADFAMPGMNGAELARHVAAVKPGLPFLIVTGYADRSAIAEVPEDSIVQKPFDPAALRARLARMAGR